MHLSAGVFAGIVVLIMSVTGVLLTYQKQMQAWADTRQHRAAPPSPDAKRLPVEVLLGKVRDEKGKTPTTVIRRADPAEPAGFAFGREGTVYVNPYTGAVLGEGSTAMRSFFQGVTEWHRYIAAGGENRATGKAITGASNLAFLFTVCSGLYLWWPRSWTWTNVKSVMLFRGGLSGKARDFNWHNVIGFWCCVPLFFVVLGATVISYPWASNLVYRAVGEEPPVAKQGPGPRAAGKSAGKAARGGEAVAPGSQLSSSARVEAQAGESRDGLQAKSTPGVADAAQPTERPRREGVNGEDRRGANSRNEGSGRDGRRGPDAGDAEVPPDLSFDGIDILFARAEQQAEGWTMISLTVPDSNNKPVSFLIDQGMGGQPHLRSTLTLDRQTAQIVKWETFADNSTGRQLRTWLRFIHTGEAGGFAGQTIAGIASAGACVLVWTGLALSWRRFRAWRGRRGMPVALPRASQSAGGVADSALESRDPATMAGGRRR
jgi:uncharacterized iron-regulated membrane protein